jgi:hypothetical protein
MTPISVIAGDVIVGDIERACRAEAPFAEAGSSAFASPKSDLHVGRLQVAVNDALCVGRFERLRDLPGDRERLVDRDRAFGHAVGERWPFDQLHDQGGHAVRSFQSVELRRPRFVSVAR